MTVQACVGFILSLLLLSRDASAVEKQSDDYWVEAGVSAVVVGVAALADGPVRDWARDHQDDRADAVFTAFEMMGQREVAIPVAVLYAGGYVFKDEKAKDAALSAVLASALGAGVITESLKYSAGRARPRQNMGTYNFRPFSGDMSFPSGHAAEAFSVASAVAETYDDPWVSVPLYLAAGITGAARIYHDAHFLSDVVAGAVIGTLSGIGSAKFVRDFGSRGGSRISIVSSVPDGSPGAMVVLVFRI